METNNNTSNTNIIKLKINGMFMNQNKTLISLATNLGYLIYNTEENFKLLNFIDEYQEFLGPLAIALPVYESQLILIVGTNDNKFLPSNLLTVWDDFTKIKLGVITLKSPILNVKLSKSIIFITVENKILLFSLKTLKYVFTLEDVNTDINKLSVSCISNPIVIAYGNLGNKKQIKIAKFVQDEEGNIISKLQVVITSEFRIQFIELSSNSEYLAIVSKHGHKIHLYSTFNYKLIACLWRGKSDAKIISINFNINNHFMALISDQLTLHIYKLSKFTKSNQNDKDHLILCSCKDDESNIKLDKQIEKYHPNYSFIANLVSSITNILSDSTNTSFARHKFISNKIWNNETNDTFNKSIIYFDKKDMVNLVNFDGVVEKIKFNKKEGGYCTLVKSFNWIN